MLTKKEIAQNINFKGDIFRTIKVNSKLKLVPGELYDSQGKIESWAHGYGEFHVENHGEYEYTFYCNNVPCHEVDYENKIEVEVLDAVEGENEVLVLDNAIMKIVSVASDDDCKEMGYYQIDLEFIGFAE
ncbi:hypothetical protein COF81_09455 [Bacillus pseudomycoides]|uniref:Uncharacterized protein n=1 Tax=Bacillus pseudomycoides TaxID=64104 RepID=A0ABD6TBS2_9BACI|nr:hypothetical protein [Bacillus pseudomycoides]PHE99935.1 hypothetical protein COF81_09455 [Bacillus pseudomycoides]